jgi:hypothetical protein
VGDPEYPLHRVLAIEAAIRGTEARASLDVVAVAKAFRVIADIDYPVDWSNWLGGEGTASAALAGLQTAEAFIARYRAIIEAER